MLIRIRILPLTFSQNFESPVIQNDPLRLPPHLYFDADPDLAFHFDSDPDPAFYSDADTDPAFYYDADPDPAFLFDAGSGFSFQK
jgi:hypothetical protein